LNCVRLPPNAVLLQRTSKPNTFPCTYQ
jgi:hypothetical protein